MNCFIQIFFTMLNFALIVCLQFSRVECQLYIEDEPFNMCLIKFTYVFAMIVNIFYMFVYIFVTGFVFIVGLLVLFGAGLVSKLPGAEMLV